MHKSVIPCNFCCSSHQKWGGSAQTVFYGRVILLHTYVTGYAKMGHPANFTQIPFLAPFDSAFFTEYFNIFIFIIRKCVAALQSPVPGTSEESPFENED